MKLRPMPSRERLDELLHFNPDTGEITWKVNRKRGRAGNIAGDIFISRDKKYRRIQIDGFRYLAHRLARFYYYGDQPIEVDHANGNGLDNRKENLRPSNREHNQKNCKMQKNNSSGVIGVRYNKRAKLWIAEYGSNKLRNKHATRKSFKDFFEAVCCRKSWENQYGMTELKKHRKT